MKGTRWDAVINECLGNIRREFKITITPIPKNKKWVFIVGCYNSGTTLLSEILGSHPLVSSLSSEGQYLTDQLFSDHEIGLSRMWTAREDLYCLKANDTGPDVTRLKKEWGMRFDLSKSTLLEKTPANMARMTWLQANFENNYFVAIVRNGYAVAEGISRKAKPIHRKDGWPIELAAHQWARSNEIMMKDAEQIKQFKLITYEKLSEEPQETIRDVLRFLDLDENGINLSQNWSIHERSESIKNLNNISIERLDAEKLDLINAAAEAILEKFSYPILSSPSL